MRTALLIVTAAVALAGRYALAAETSTAACAAGHRGPHAPSGAEDATFEVKQGNTPLNPSGRVLRHQNHRHHAPRKVCRAGKPEYGCTNRHQKSCRERFHLTFDSNPSTACAGVPAVSTSAPGWIHDRFAGSGGSYCPVFFCSGHAQQEGRLNIQMIDVVPDSIGSFYRYQGQKYLDQNAEYWKAGRGSVFHASVYVDPSWNSVNSEAFPKQTGVWLTLGSIGNAISYYPILEYFQPADSSTGKFRVFAAFIEDDEIKFGWHELDFDVGNGGWFDLSAELVPLSNCRGSAMHWYVNCQRVFVDDHLNLFGPTDRILEVIINSNVQGATDNEVGSNCKGGENTLASSSDHVSAKNAQEPVETYLWDDIALLDYDA